MRRKYQKLPQQQLNEIVVDRLLKEVADWPQECVDDLVFYYNDVFEEKITDIQELKDTVKKVDPEVFAENLDEILDEQGDAFGTERQCDPRGDFRNGDWNMWEIE